MRRIILKLSGTHCGPEESTGAFPTISNRSPGTVTEKRGKAEKPLKMIRERKALHLPGELQRERKGPQGLSLSGEEKSKFGSSRETQRNLSKLLYKLKPSESHLTSTSGPSSAPRTEAGTPSNGQGVDFYLTQRRSPVRRNHTY